MEAKVCGKCKQEKPVSEFYKSTRDGYRSRCKVCHREDCLEFGRDGYYARYNKEYYGRPDVKAKVRVRMQEYRQLPRVKIKTFTQHYINNEITQGRVKREPCALCGAKQTQAHHPDYYEPLWIVWLCADCHTKIHLTLKEKENEGTG